MVARGGGPFRRSLVFLRFCYSYDLWFSLFCVHIQKKLLQAKHRPKSQAQTKSLNLMLLFPPSIPLTSPSIIVPLCMCLCQIFSEPLIFFSQFSFPFLLEHVLLSCFLSLFEHPNHCQVSHWVTKIKAEFLSPWAHDWMSVSSGDLTSSKSFKHIDSFPMGSSTSGVVVSSPRWTKNGTAESLMLVSSISFCQLNYTTAHTTT